MNQQTHPTPLLEMRDISVSFGGIKAVDHVSIDVHAGEVVGLLGHNGADNLDAASNLFLGRELVTPYGLVDDSRMEAETRKIMGRLNPNFRKFSVPVSALSGGQRQSVAIARAVYFDARILIMDEPTAALGPHETQMVAELIQELKAQGLGIFLIEHDIHNVMKLCDRASVMKNGQLVGTVDVKKVTDDDILGMIILGKKPAIAA